MVRVVTVSVVRPAPVEVGEQTDAEVDRCGVNRRVRVVVGHVVRRVTVVCRSAIVDHRTVVGDAAVAVSRVVRIAVLDIQLRATAVDDRSGCERIGGELRMRCAGHEQDGDCEGQTGSEHGSSPILSRYRAPMEVNSH